MRRSQAGHRYLSDECLEACRIKLTAVLARLTTGRRCGELPARPVSVPAVCDSTIELALFCRRNLPANRMDWSGFLTRQASEALERIENGSYGFCLQCGQHISAKRLAALPWAALCTDCQEGKSEYGVS